MIWGQIRSILDTVLHLLLFSGIGKLFRLSARRTRLGFCSLWLAPLRYFYLIKFYFNLISPWFLDSTTLNFKKRKKKKKKSLVWICTWTCLLCFGCWLVIEAVDPIHVILESHEHRSCPLHMHVWLYRLDKLAPTARIPSKWPFFPGASFIPIT